MFMLCTSSARKLIRGKGWKKEDFYFGIDLHLSTLALCFSYATDLFIAKNQADFARGVKAIGWATLTLCFLFIIMGFHQDWEKQRDHPRRAFLFLGIIFNLIGIFIMCGFLMWIKGV